jgi:hypothetical protein
MSIIVAKIKQKNIYLAINLGLYQIFPQLASQ